MARLMYIFPGRRENATAKDKVPLFKYVLVRACVLMFHGGTAAFIQAQKIIPTRRTGNVLSGFQHMT